MVALEHSSSASHVAFLCFLFSRDFDSLSKDDVYENNRLVSPYYAVHKKRKGH